MFNNKRRYCGRIRLCSWETVLHSAVPIHLGPFSRRYVSSNLMRRSKRNFCVACRIQLKCFSKLHRAGLPWQKLHSTRRGLFFYYHIGFKIEEEASKMLHLEHSLYGAETWTFRAVDLKHLESFEMCWRRMEIIIWRDHVRNEEVLLKSQGAEEYPT